MKHKTKIWTIATAMAFISCCSFGQDASAAFTPRWVSDKGYWVVETNVHAPLDHVIRFYNNDNVMIYSETLQGMKLNTNRNKIKMKLKKALESAVSVWELKKTPEENKNYVSAILRK